MTGSAPTKTKGPSFPRRDAKGRIGSVGELLGGVVGNLVLGAVLLIVIDGIATLTTSGSFGRISGWLAGILMVFMFIEEFRAWQIGPARIAVAFVAGALGLLAGIAAVSWVTGLNPLFTGAIGVTVAGVIYSFVWFYGIREVAGRFGER